MDCAIFPAAAPAVEAVVIGSLPPNPALPRLEHPASDPETATNAHSAISLRQAPPDTRLLIDLLALKYSTQIRIED